MCYDFSRYLFLHLPAQSIYKVLVLGSERGLYLSSRSYVPVLLLSFPDKCLDFFGRHVRRPVPVTYPLVFLLRAFFLLRAVRPKMSGKM